MSTTVKIAYRNLWRNPRRTILTLGAIAFAAAVIVFFVALQLSSYDTSIQANVAIFQGALQVQKEGYLDTPEMRESIPEARTLRDEVVAIPGIRDAALRSFGFSLVSSEKRSYGVQVLGVEATKEPKVSTIPGLLKEGSYFSSDAGNEAVIGRTLAKNLKVGIGDELSFIGQSRDGSLAAFVLDVVGIYESGVRELDRAMIQMPFKTFDDVFFMQGHAHAIVADVDTIKDVELLEEKIEAQLGPESELTALRWDELVPGLKQAIELDMASGWIFYMSLVLVVTFSILNTFLMSVLERTRELSVMLALGTKPGRLSLMVLIECVTLTTIGLLFGMLFGTLIVWYFGVQGFAVPGSEEIMKHWNLPSAVHTELSAQALFSGPIVIFVFALLASIYPALRVRSVSPINSLRLG